MLSRHDNDSSALSECTKVMPRKSAWQLLAESEKEQNKQQCTAKQAEISSLPSSLCEIAITGKQATRYFLLWSLSVASSFLHLQLDQETGAGKEPKNSVVPQLFSDSWWRWDLLVNYRKRHNNHSAYSLFLPFTLLHHIFLGFSNNHILFAGLLSVLPSAINWLWYPPHPQTPRSIAPAWDFLLIQWNLQVFCEAPTTPHPSYNVGESGKK